MAAARVIKRAVDRGRRWVVKGRYAARASVVAARGLVPRPRTIELDHVQRRVELLLTAMYGRPIPISPIQEKKRGWLHRVARLVMGVPREATAAVDATAIHLPAVLDARDGADAALKRLRLLAVEQAERLARGTAVHAPAADPLERDLYLLRESAAIDARIARALPGMEEHITAERRAALSRRPKLERLTAAERDVELRLRKTLESAPASADAESSDPSESLAWAKSVAASLRGSGRYRGIPPARLWGTVMLSHDPPAEPPQQTDVAPPMKSLLPPTNATGFRNSRSQSDEADALDQSGSTPDQAPSPNVPPGDSDVDSNTAADSHEQTVKEPLRDPDATTPRIAGHDPIFGAGRVDVVDEAQLDGLPPGILYDEWDSDAGRYVPRAVTVRLYESAAADASWAAETLLRHAALVRQVRHRFERLRARRTLLGRQRDGDALDIAACVDAMVDRRLGRPPDDRLYIDARPARRGVAISLLVDTSGSTEARVAEQLRILDLEKIALLLASEALDALGDLYAINAFAGKTASNVKVVPVKAFSEPGGAGMHARIAALKSDGFTRLGAAVRHATRELAHQTAGHRLLLILSDGRPNDLDQYQGPYGVEDSRQAIMEARASGVFPFCLTVDHEASEYLPRIFGTAGHTILQRPEQLPTALLGAVKTLIRRPS